MKGVTIKIFTKAKDLPHLSSRKFFHSKELFDITAQSPGCSPYMFVAYNEQSEIIAHLLATLRHRGSLLPPYIYTHVRVYGKGEYAAGVNQEELFDLFVKAINRKFRWHLCFYMEFSDIHPKMFGYGVFRRNGYFPIPWQEVHNSLHSHTPEERLTNKQIKRIRRLEQVGVSTYEAKTPEDLDNFYQMLKSFSATRLRRYIPPKEQFLQLRKNENARILITKIHDKIIGGCALVFSENNAFLWYLASKKRRFLLYHPNFMTVWGAIKYAQASKCDHIYFMDVGLPFRKNHFRSFILSFGGKPVAKYRWFKFWWAWLNRLLSWLYRE